MFDRHCTPPGWAGHERPFGRRGSGGCGPRDGDGASRFAAGDEDWGGRFRGRPGEPGGRGSYGPPGRRGGRMFGPGDLRLVILHLIAESPRHGYELIKAIEDAFGGQYAPSPGAIYPTLTLLEEQELIAPIVDAADARKRYQLTPAGQLVLTENRAVVDGVLARIRMAASAMSGDRPPEAILQAMRTLRHALMLRRGRWTDDEVARVAALLQSAAQAIVGPDGNGARPGGSEGRGHD